ncbi:unnamed protein product [Clavelina lepadiformis]|uniref:Secreted protein n=1 Tax=Clavelina lepadiformis TaxID=159417 RepID=A0ABP0FXH7_CLALP
MDKLILFCVVCGLFRAGASNSDPNNTSGHPSHNASQDIWRWLLKSAIFCVSASNAGSSPLSQFIWKLLKTKGFWSAFIRSRLQVPARSEVVKKDNLLNANFLGK